MTHASHQQQQRQGPHHIAFILADLIVVNSSIRSAVRQLLDGNELVESVQKKSEQLVAASVELRSVGNALNGGWWWCVKTKLERLLRWISAWFEWGCVCDVEPGASFSPLSAKIRRV